jgi:hypothetical protein
MTIRHLIWAIILGFVLLTSIVHAVPTGGAASGITSNNFTVAVTGSDGGDVWIAWGTASGAHPWGSSYITGNGDVTVYGAPIIGGSTIYYIACDSTGCDTNEQHLSIPAITAVPTSTFGAGYRAMTNRHFAIDSIAPNILPGYFATGISASLLWGIMFFFIIFGFWFRTRSVRLVLILALLMAVFILSPTAGLMLGTPLMFQYVAQGLMAAAIAGVLIGFIRK